MSAAQAATDIVLVGGGHAHVHVMKAFAARPEPGVRVTLVARDLETPYSGMLPGLVAGHYTHDEAHIDLTRLAAATGTRLVHASAVGLDLSARRVQLDGGSDLGYDLLSIDVGITPDLAAIEGAATHGIAVKPIAHCIEKIERLLAEARRPEGPRRIAVVGGGAGGVELVLSLRHRLLAEARRDGRDPAGFAFALLTSGRILATHDQRVRRAFRRLFAQKGVTLLEDSPVAALEEGAIRLRSGAMVAADATLMTTNAAAPEWLAGTGLRTEKGFLAVGPTLQTSDPRVFAAGDCAALTRTPREKAGVYAVRAGPPLARNLRLLARGETPRPWTPQRRHLALIGTGDRHAVASRGCFKAEGAWVWAAKDWNDRRWMRQYQEQGGA